MFIGHFGVAFGAKKSVPGISLGTLFLASQLLDLLWPTFLLLGWEEVVISPGNTKMTPLEFTHYPISHSLLMVLGWGFVTGLIYFLVRRNYKGALALGLCVVSHWVLDLLVHAPDLPLYPGESPLLGFGLWNHVVMETIVEALIFITGLVLYLRTVKPANKTGSFALWSLVVFLVVIHFGNLFGPPPPDVNAIAWVGQSQWLLVVWAYWADKNFTLRDSSPGEDPVHRGSSLA